MGYAAAYSSFGDLDQASSFEMYGIISGGAEDVEEGDTHRIVKGLAMPGHRHSAEVAATYDYFTITFSLIN